MNRAIARFAFCFVALLGAALVVADEKGALEKSFPVRGHGDLQLTIPSGWKISDAPPVPGLGKTIRLTGEPERKFEVLITIIPPPGEDAGFNAPAKLRQAAEAGGNSILPTAKETKLDIQEAKGPSATAYYFTLTDKAPDPGSFENITSGFAGVGDLMLSFTVLHHQKDTPERLAALAMLQGATQGKAVPVPEAAELHIAAPGGGWELVLPIKGLEVEADRTDPAHKARQVMAVNNKTGITVSVFMEPAAGRGDSAAVRDLYWGRAKQSPMKKDKITLGKAGGYATVQYIVPDLEGLVVNQKNLNVYIAHEGVWIDLHVSKMQYVEKDQAMFDAITKGAKIQALPAEK